MARPGAAMSWYAEEDCYAIQAVMTENIAFANYAAWLRAAEQLEASLHAKGGVALRNADRARNVCRDLP